MISLAASPPADSGSVCLVPLFIPYFSRHFVHRVKPKAVDFPTCRKCRFGLAPNTFSPCWTSFTVHRIMGPPAYGRARR